MVQMSTLTNIAGIGGIVTALTGFALNGILKKRVTDSPVYKETMKIIRNHPEAEKVLGKPVKSDDIDIRNSNNILSLRFSSLEIPVYGPKNKGTLYLCADRISSEDSWNIYNLELRIWPNDELEEKISIINKSPLLPPIEGMVENKD